MQKGARDARVLGSRPAVRQSLAQPGVHAAHVRTLHVVVGRDEASSVGGGADGGEVQARGVGSAAGGDEHGVELERVHLLLGLERENARGGETNRSVRSVLASC